MEERKREEVRQMIKKLIELDDTGRKVIKIQTEALYARQMLDEKQTA